MNPKHFEPTTSIHAANDEAAAISSPEKIIYMVPLQFFADRAERKEIVIPENMADFIPVAFLTNYAFQDREMTHPLKKHRKNEIIPLDSFVECRLQHQPGLDFVKEMAARSAGYREADAAFISKATRLVETHISRGGVNVEWLARQMCMSRTQLYRKIRAILNLSVYEFVTDVKMDKAAKWLRAGHYNITEVAFMIGYLDPSSFGRVFQKYYGMTPKKYSQLQLAVS